MHPTSPLPAEKFDLQDLVAAIGAASPGEDALRNTLAAAQWELLASYLQPVHLAAGELLFEQNAVDRNVYFVESGSMSVHYEDDKGRLRLALVGAGSALGEGSFFSHRPRSATVQASTACKLWMLSAVRFTELTNRQPAVALGITLALGSVLATRLVSRRRRVAAT